MSINKLLSLGFKKMDADDVNLLVPFYRVFSTQVSDISLVNLFLWKEKYAFHWCIFDNYAWIANVAPSGIYFSQPIGSYEDVALVRRAVEKMKERLHDSGLAFVIKKSNKLFMDMIGQDVVISTNRDEWDYIYDYEKMRTLPGNAYHKKKNLVNQFHKKYPHHVFKAFQADHMTAYRVFYNQWCHERACDETIDLTFEKEGTFSLLEALEPFVDVYVFGLWLEGVLIGFIVAEGLGDTLIVHVEKGLTAYTGVYQALGMMLYEELKTLGFKWVNREQDLGLDGLRQAKLSYHPEYLLEKFTITF